MAVAFLALQLWALSYRTASNNLLAMAVSGSLVLDFISEARRGEQRGEQRGGGGDINPLASRLRSTRPRLPSPRSR